MWKEGGVIEGGTPSSMLLNYLYLPLGRFHLLQIRLKTLVFDAPQEELIFVPPARVGNIRITSGTSVCLSPTVDVLQMNVCRDDAGRPGDGSPEAVLRIASSDAAMLTANKFLADRVRVEQSGPLGRAEYDWGTSVLHVAAGQTAFWKPTAVLNIGGLVGEGTLNLASTIPTLMPICDCIFAGQIDSQSAVNGATEVEQLLLHPSPASGNSPDRQQPKQVFSNSTIMPAGASLPMVVEGAHAELNGIWRGDVTVRRYADPTTGERYAGELGGIGTIEGGLSLYVGTILDISQGGALTVNGPLSLPKYNEPLVFRLPDNLEAPFPVIYTAREHLAADALTPGNLPQVVAVNQRSEVIPGAVSLTYATLNGKSGLWLTFTSYAEMAAGETKNWHGYFEDNADTGAVRWTGQNRVHTVGAPNSTTVSAVVTVSGNATLSLNGAAAVDALYIIGKEQAPDGTLSDLTLRAAGGTLTAQKTKIGVNPEDPGASPDPIRAAGLTIVPGAVSSLGPVSVVNGRLTLASGATLSDNVTVGPQGILAADGATLSGSVTLEDGATVDAQGVNDCPTLNGALTLPTQLNIIVPSDGNVSATNPISFELFAMAAAPANLTATTVTLVDTQGQVVPGLSNVYSLEYNGTHLVATSEPLWFRELNGDGNWSQREQWVNIEKQRPRSAPTKNSTAILTVLADSTLTINDASTLKRLNIAGPNAVTFNQGTNASRQITSGVSQIETSVTVNDGAQINLGAVSIANGGSLKMTATAVCTSVEVQAGGTLHGGTEVSGMVTLHDGATVAIDNIHAPLTANGGLSFDNPAGTLKVSVPAGPIKEGTTLIAASGVDPAAAPAVTLIGANDALLIARWEPDGLVVRSFGSVLPLPNGKTADEDASHYSDAALCRLKELTGGAVPTRVIATTQCRQRLLSAAEAAAAVDCFTNVAHWDPVARVLSVQYEFGITRATYVTATQLQGRAAVVNATPSGKTAQIRSGVTLAFYINEVTAPECQAILPDETKDGTYTREWKRPLDGTPGVARVTVRAFPPGSTPAAP